MLPLLCCRRKKGIASCGGQYQPERLALQLQTSSFYRFTSIPYSSAASRRLTFSFTISKIRMIPPFLRKNGGLPDLGQAAVCVFSYAVFLSSSFLASRKAFFRAPCRLICAAYRQSSLQYFTSDLVVINSLPQFSQVHTRLRPSAAS